MSQKQMKKRERGANYTPEEKAMLTDLVVKYKHIVEDKRTGGHILLKKKEAWKAITMHYNSNCTTGPRTTDHLKALYDNLKQKLRKNAGEKNKLEYININQQSDEKREYLSKDDLSRALKHLKEDKVELHKTGGGAWTPKVTETDAKILAIIQDQIEPLANPYDSSAVYFKDHDYHEACPNLALENGMEPDIPVLQIPAQENEININTEMETDILMQPSTSFANSQEIQITVVDQALQHKPEPVIVCTPVIACTPVKKVAPALRKLSCRQKKVARKLIKPQSAEVMKRIYFKKKCENANLEKKKLMQEILHSKQIHSLKMAILKKELNNK